MSVAFSPDGQTLASGNIGGEIKFWQVNSGRELSSIKAHEENIWALNWNNDGTKLYSGSSDAKIKIWDTATGNEIATLDSPTCDCPIFAMTLSPDNRVLVAGASTLKFWDVENKTELADIALDTRDAISEIQFSKDGKTLVTTGRGGARVWKKDNGEVITLP